MAERIYEESKRGHSPSIIGSMLNPLTQLKYQYFSILSLSTYSRMAARGSFSFSPFFLWSAFIPKEILAKTTMYPWTPGKGDTLKKALGFFTGKGGWEFEGYMKGLLKEAGIAEQSGITSNIIKGLKDYTIKNKWRHISNNAVYDKVMSHIPEVGPGKAAELIPKIFTAVKRTQAFSRIGSVALPIWWGYTIGTTTAHLAGLAFKGALAATDFVSNEIESIRNIEFGGTLGPGYRTGAAVTERQRSIVELQRSHVPSQRFMGSEASVYSALI